MALFVDSESNSTDACCAEVFLVDLRELAESLLEHLIVFAALFGAKEDVERVHSWSLISGPRVADEKWSLITRRVISTARRRFRAVWIVVVAHVRMRIQVGTVGLVVIRLFRLQVAETREHIEKVIFKVFQTIICDHEPRAAKARELFEVLFVLVAGNAEVGKGLAILHDSRRWNVAE